MKDFRELHVWQKVHQLVLASYRLTASFPREELYGLTSQIRRCSASVAANIAEGCGRRGNAEFHRFLQIASGSGSELEYHWLLARDLDFISAAEHKRVEAMTVEVRKMLTALVQRVASDREGAKC